MLMGALRHLRRWGCVVVRCKRWVAGTYFRVFTTLRIIFLSIRRVVERKGHLCWKPFLLRYLEKE